MELTEPHRDVQVMQEAPGPARPRRPTLLSSDRKTDKGSRPVVPCMFTVCHVWSERGGLEGRSAKPAAAGRGADPLRRLRAPAPGRRRQVTKW